MHARSCLGYECPELDVGAGDERRQLPRPSNERIGSRHDVADSRRLRGGGVRAVSDASVEPRTGGTCLQFVPTAEARRRWPTVLDHSVVWETLYGRAESVKAQPIVLLVVYSATRTYYSREADSTSERPTGTSAGTSRTVWPPGSDSTASNAPPCPETARNVST